MEMISVDLRVLPRVLARSSPGSARCRADGENSSFGVNALTLYDRTLQQPESGCERTRAGSVAPSVPSGLIWMRVWSAGINRHGDRG